MGAAEQTTPHIGTHTHRVKHINLKQNFNHTCTYIRKKNIIYTKVILGERLNCRRGGDQT